MGLVRIEAASVEETQELGVALGHAAQPGDCLVLDGGLGAGKTQLVKGMARGLGISEPVTSPTFNIVCDYTTGRLELLHLDLYRLEDPAQLDDIGFAEIVDSDAVVAIEWGAQFPDMMPDDRLDVVIEELPGDNEARALTLVPHGPASDALVQAVVAERAGSTPEGNA